MTAGLMPSVMPHLPILQVVVPMLAAPLCFLLRRGTVTWAFTTLVTWAAFATSLALLQTTLADGTIRYEIGGWAPPWGIEYVIDATNAAVLVIVSGIAAVVMPSRDIEVTTRFFSTKNRDFTIQQVAGISVRGKTFCKLAIP